MITEQAFGVRVVDGKAKKTVNTAIRWAIGAGIGNP